MTSKEIKIKVKEEGYIQAIAVFEVVGSPKEHIQRALQAHLDKLVNDKDIEVIKTHVEDPEKQDTYWSTFAEVELLVKGLDKFTWMCMNFMPASVEIMAPEELTFKGRELTGWLNDLLAKLHEIGVLSQQVGQQNKALIKNINALIRNSVLTCIDAGINNKSGIAKKVGVSEKDLKPVFEAMIKEGKIKKSGKKYSRK
ncbi:hypothetical protein HQ533_01525 [Candidatus Woesearchaeota archaeon]|nr:hypothetical protein [Candidatus Woesearchaeota archaeon]